MGVYHRAYWGCGCVEGWLLVLVRLGRKPPLRAGCRRGRRRIQWAATLVAALLLAGCNGATDGMNEAPTQEFDVVFEGARVIDPERRLDEVRSVGIRGGVIAALTEEPLAESLADGGVLIDAAGLVLAPGFVDLHAHGQGPASHEYQARDGVTTAGLSFSEGIHHTMVNGVFVVRDGETVPGVAPGRAIVGR